MRVVSIRWKLFALIACSVAAPVISLAVYFPATEDAVLHAALAKKAVSFGNILADQSRSSIAFDDGQTARELFDAIATDSDVTFVGIFRADGSQLYAMGQREGAFAPGAQTLVTTGARRVSVVSPVVSPEGPRGYLVLELSTARAHAAVTRARQAAAIVGLLALAMGLMGAWLVGHSFGRRIERVHLHARRVDDGDLSDLPQVDGSADEIGQLSRAFRTMVQSLKRGYDSIERQVMERTEALRASREQFRALVETTEAVPWEMDTSTHSFTYIGPQAASLLDVPASDWSDGAWRNRVFAEDIGSVDGALKNSSRHEEAIEFRLRRSNGRQLWIRMLISAEQNAETTRARGFMFDVTTRAEMEAELRQAQKLESVGRLAAGIAHEINTPVQFVSDSIYFVRDAFGDVSQLLERYRRLGAAMEQTGTDAGQAQAPDNRADASATDYYGQLVELRNAESDADLDYLVENVPAALNRAIEGLGRVTTIVRSMKEFAHPDREGKAAANLNQALASTLVIARNEYKDVADVETSFGELPDVSCYLGELNQAFLNIIVNAAHALEDTAKQGRRGLIRVTTRAEGGSALVVISDSGSGIPVDVRGRIFDPFFTTKEVGRGTGQGLAIAHRSVVERHAGSLTFESTIDEGTSFFIRIPLDQAQAAAS